LLLIGAFCRNGDVMSIRPNGHIWMAAEQFFNAAESIWNSAEGDLSKYVYPLLVNYSFACELALKSAEGKVKQPPIIENGLIPVSTIHPAVKGHNLLSIFNKLKPETRKGIEKEFISITGENLTPLLKKCGYYFEKARYPFEQKGGAYNLSAVRDLAKILLDSVMAFGLKSA